AASRRSSTATRPVSSSTAATPTVECSLPGAIPLTSLERCADATDEVPVRGQGNRYGSPRADQRRGKPQLDLQTALIAGLRVHLRSVGERDRSNDRESQPESTIEAESLTFEPSKRLEKLLEPLRRNDLARVADPQNGRFRLDRGLHPDPTILGDVVGDCVVDQVRHHPLEQGGISVDDRAVERGLDGQGG